jgi:hypothetical protein
MPRPALEAPASSPRLALADKQASRVKCACAHSARFALLNAQLSLPGQTIRSKRDSKEDRAAAVAAVRSEVIAQRGAGLFLPGRLAFTSPIRHREASTLLLRHRLGEQPSSGSCRIALFNQRRFSRASALLDTCTQPRLAVLARFLVRLSFRASTRPELSPSHCRPMR